MRTARQLLPRTATLDVKRCAHGQTHSLQEPSLGPVQRQVPQSELVEHWPQNETLGVGFTTVMKVAYLVAELPLPASVIVGHDLA